MHKVVIKGNYYGRTRTLPDLNDYLHEWCKASSEGAKWKEITRWSCVTLSGHSCRDLRLQTLSSFITTSMSRDKQRDKGNIFSFADKVFQDALQKCGVIKNDGWKEIENFTHDFYVDKKNPRIEIFLEEIEKGPFDGWEKVFLAQNAPELLWKTLYQDT